VIEEGAELGLPEPQFHEGVRDPLQRWVVFLPSAETEKRGGVLEERKRLRSIQTLRKVEALDQETRLLEGAPVLKPHLSKVGYIPQRTQSVNLLWPLR